MAKYTTLVRSICETAAGLDESTGYANVNQVIKGAIPSIFSFDFPIFDEAYREVLCTKVLKHYYMREIGAETVGLWKLWLDTRLNEIMPYYNKLYESELIEFNPLYDVDLTRMHNTTGKRDETVDRTEKMSENGENTSKVDVTNSGTSSGETSGTDNSKDRYSDTPQGSLQNIENDNYLTNARIVDRTNSANDSQEYNNTGTSDTNDTHDVTRDTTGNETGTVSTTEDYLEKVEGKQGSGSYSKLLLEYRDTFLNIDLMIINELSDLFITIW